MKTILKTLAMGVLVSAAVGAQSALAAMTTLKQVQVSNGAQVDLLFDGKVTKNQIQTEFFNDIVQISLNDVAVYPAKISSVNGGQLTKVFAYQYAPKLVRCRLTVKGKAEDYKDKVLVTANGKILTVRLGGDTIASDRISTQAAQASRVPPAAAAPEIKDPEERALLERVMSAGKEKPVEAPPAQAPTKNEKALKKEAATKEAARERDNVEEREPLTGRKTAEYPSPMKVIGKLAAVLALFGALAFVFKRFILNRDSGGGDAFAKKNPGLFGAISRFTTGNKKGKLIQVIATHYLGPKKSIAVVRVVGRLLVLSVSDNAVNLITELPDENNEDLEALGELPSGIAGAFMNSGGTQVSNREEPSLFGAGKNERRSSGAGATAAGNAIFSDLLGKEKGKATNAVANQAYQSPSGGVRSQIKSRLEGLKQL